MRGQPTLHCDICYKYLADCICGKPIKKQSEQAAVQYPGAVIVCRCHKVPVRVVGGKLTCVKTNIECFAQNV